MPIVVDPSLPSQTFLQLQTELYARGYDYLNESAAGIVRAKRFLNEAYLEICEYGDWPFVEGDITGAAPLTITDLRQVQSVWDNTQKITVYHKDRRWLRDTFGNLAQTGSCTWYYLEGTILNLYPVDASASLRVRYLAIPPVMSGNTDVPVIPNAYQHLIVDGAVLRCMKDDDNFADVDALKQSYIADIERMRSNYLNRDLLDPDFIETTEVGNTFPSTSW
jgi:hypothetical protein